MSHIIRALAVIEANTLLSEDNYVNTWHFTVESTPPSAATLDAIGVQLISFYSTFGASMSTELLGGNMSVKFYDLADPKPRQPLLTKAGTITGVSAGASAPPEVSMVLSFQGIPVSGVAQARRRGRVYLPPFKVSTLAGAGFFSSTVQTTVKGAANALLTASNGATDWKWVVYSPTSAATATVAKGWVDNAPDIQRRRGRKSTSRLVYP